MPSQRRQANQWRTITRADFGISAKISDAISRSEAASESNIYSFRRSPWLFIFSDYGGAHKGARYEVFSYLVTIPASLLAFNTMRMQLRRAGLGDERRMAYKALNDNIRLRSLTGYLDSADFLIGALISFAVDKRALHRFNEPYRPDTAFGALGPWAAKPFSRLSRIAHLAAILFEGFRADGQNLLWVTDEDDIVANQVKHSEATRLIGHILSCYCTADLGHFRFATTASDAGDLLIEDLTAIPDLAAGSLNDILSRVGLRSQSRIPERLFIADDGMASFKIQCIANWLSDSSATLKKVNIVIDESPGGCWIRRVTIQTQPSPLLDYGNLGTYQ